MAAAPDNQALDDGAAADKDVKTDGAAADVGGLDDDLEEAKITLISGGDKQEKFEITETQAKLAQLIQTMITGLSVL